MTAPRLPATPSLDDLAHAFGVGASTPTPAPAHGSATPSLDDLAGLLGLSNHAEASASAGGSALNGPASATDIAARAADLLNSASRGGVAPVRADATNEGRSVGVPHAYSPSDAFGDVKEGLGEAAEAIKHLPSTAVGILKQAAGSAAETFDSPVIGEQRPESDYLRGKGIDLTPNVPYGGTFTTQNSPDAITPAEFGRAAVNTVANAALPMLPGGVVARLGANAALGAINDPDKPVRGATAMLGLGELLHAAMTHGPAVAGSLSGKIADAIRARADEVTNGNPLQPPSEPTAVPTDAPETKQIPS